MATPMMKQFTADMTDANVGCSTYECSILVNVGMKQLRDDFALYDLEKETDLIVAISDIYIEFVTRHFRECDFDGRPLIYEDKEARDNAFEELLNDGRDVFSEECRSGRSDWWDDGIIGAYADKNKRHEFAKLIHYVRQEHKGLYNEDVMTCMDRMDAEDVFGWLIYFASEHLDLTLEKVWVDSDKYEEGAEILERYRWKDGINSKKN